MQGSSACFQTCPSRFRQVGSFFTNFFASKFSYLTLITLRCNNSFVYLFNNSSSFFSSIHLLIYSSFFSCILPIILLSSHRILLLIHLSFHILIHSFIHLLIHPSFHVFILSSILLLIHSSNFVQRVLHSKVSWCTQASALQLQTIYRDKGNNILPLDNKKNEKMICIYYICFLFTGYAKSVCCSESSAYLPIFQRTHR